MAGSGDEIGAAGAGGGEEWRGVKVSDENGDRSTGRLGCGGIREAEEERFGRYRSQFHGRFLLRREMKRKCRDFEGFRSEEDEERRAVLKP